MATIDPRKLTRLATTARKLGISRLKLSDGTEFELGPTSTERPAAKLVPVASAEPRREFGSLEALRKRFARRAE